MSETPTDIRGVSPALGADTESVMQAVGMSQEDIKELRRDGVIL